MTEKWSYIDSAKPFIREAWEKANFDTPSTIQEKAIPFIEKGIDVIAKSPTGTGKTLAYVLPVLNAINKDNTNIQAVILASSHELVMQIHDEIQKWSMGSGLKSASFIGGANVKRQLEKLKNRPQIIVGTPGRMLELIKLKKLKMHEVKTIVLDEGDQLLVPEHLDTIKNIIKSTQSDRQLLLFSATLKENTEQIAKDLMTNPEIFKIEKEENNAAITVEHYYIVSEMRNKIDILRSIARIKNIKAIVFMRDIGNLNVYSEKLAFKGISVGVLHSDIKKQERANTIKAFQSGKIPLLLATDIAARGIDIPDITHVIQVDLPKDVEQYIHRAGRTGRLGSTSGTVVSIITERDEKKLKQFGNKLGIEIMKVKKTDFL